MEPQKKQAKESNWHPGIGQIYRDAADQSFVILSVNRQQTLVEFADGTIKRFSKREWQASSPKPAVY